MSGAAPPPLPSGVAQPPLSLVTPQAGASKSGGLLLAPLRSGDMEQFFDRRNYQGNQTTLSPSTTRVVQHEMITTKENIKQFFNPLTYIRACPQKRPSPSLSSTASSQPKAKARLSRNELLDKFKLAAELNGIDWSDLAVSRLLICEFCFYFKMFSKQIGTTTDSCTTGGYSLKMG